MDSVIVTTGNNNRLKTRVRSNLARNSKNRSSFNRQHSFQNKNNRLTTGISSMRTITLKNNANQLNLNKNNINNLNGNREIVNDKLYVNNNGGEVAHLPVIRAEGFTREVYDAICPRLGHTLHIPEESVQALFNDMHLYPSKSQVSEMLQCARQCSRRNGTARYLTFGEFCVFVREMQNITNGERSNGLRHHRRNQTKTNNNVNGCTNNCEVFLGGSCNPTTWRMDTAIPELQKHGISFYNPQVTMWAPELVAQEHDAKQSASVLLFVVDSQTRSTGGMIEVAYLVASGRCVVLVAHPYRPNQMIMGEMITQKEYKDLVEGQRNLLFLVKNMGVKVHSSLSAALQCTASILRNSTMGECEEEQITYKLRRLKEVFDSYGGNRTGQISFYDVMDAYEKLTQRSLKIGELYEYMNASNEKNVTDTHVTFERFCMLMAEFTTNGRCDTCTTNNDGSRFANPLYWDCALLKTRHLFNSYVVQPVTSVIAWATQPFQRQCSTNNNSCNTDYQHFIRETQDDDEDNERNMTRYDVFLCGTSFSHTDWRRELAIPLLKKHGLTYYNPAVRETENNDETYLDNDGFLKDDESDVMMAERKRAMDASRVLLFVVTEDERSLTTMILAAHSIGLGRNVVLVIRHLPENDCVIANETLSKQAIKDYNRGRVYLSDLAKRKQLPVFENITEAMQCAIDKCQNR